MLHNFRASLVLILIISYYKFTLTITKYYKLIVNLVSCACIVVVIRLKESTRTYKLSFAQFASKICELFYEKFL